MGPAAQERGKNEKVSLTFSCQILVSRILENSPELFSFNFLFLCCSFVFPDLFNADRFTSETSMSLALSKG